MDLNYKVFVIERYQCAWVMANAVVAAETPEEASTLLRTYLETKTLIGRRIMETPNKDIEFLVRGTIRTTSFFADRRGVIYPVKETED